MSDPFDEIVSGLELDEDTTDVIDMTELSMEELLQIVADETEALMDDGQAIRPRTQQARDSHSLRAAARIEIQRRQTK